MSTQFSLTLPGETVFGWGRLRELSAHLPPGVRVGIARGGGAFERSGLAGRVGALLDAAGMESVVLPPQTREPEPEDVDAATTLARQAGVGCVLAIGGGSVLDLGKAVAALAPQEADVSVRAYLEGVGDGRTLTADPLPFFAVPTTAGTGTEATLNSVISSKREGFKKSLRDRRMIADVALIDPELTVSLPPEITARTGMDALTQLIEAYTSSRAQPVTDALALGGLQAARGLFTAYQHGDDQPAREGMSLAAYLSGVCLANAGLGAAHSIAAAFGSMTDISHGLACAIALPWVMAANLPVVADRYAVIAGVLLERQFSSTEAGALAAIAHVWELLAALNIPRARDIPGVAGVLDDAHLPELAARCHGNSLRGNPRPLDDAQLISLLRAMRDAAEPV
jgi:alcohol dehydrogenase class IV